jgi:acetoin utilization deacetylase AcuC-like enzyme
MRAGLYFHHPDSHEHDPGEQIPGHPDTSERLIALERELALREWLGWQRRLAPAAREEQLELIHSAAHVRRIRELSLAGGGVIDPDTAVNASSYGAALHAAGAACEMAGALLAGEAELGFCGLRPSGHHAEAERAMGFCLFNNVAVAAASAIAELGAQRVFILDWDVHHGNGTAEVFRERGDVLFASIHQYGIYPGTGALEDVGSGPGEGFTINLPVPVADAFEPRLVLISAGFDAHSDDPLAGCRLQTSSFAEMARQLRDLARRHGAPLGLVLEGGYAPRALAKSVAATLEALADGEPARSPAPEPRLTPRAVSHFSRYWPL